MRKKTIRKTLIGALASALLLVGFAGQAVAQDDSGSDAGTDTTTDTGMDTTTDTGTDTTTDTGTDTTTDSGTDATTSAEADGTPTDVAGQGDTGIAESFATEAPNPQPGQPVAPVDGATQAAPTPQRHDPAL